MLGTINSRRHSHQSCCCEKRLPRYAQKERAEEFKSAVIDTTKNIHFPTFKNWNSQRTIVKIKHTMFCVQQPDNLWGRNVLLCMKIGK